jgi:type II secretory pathway pseudopilin PulG
MKPRVSHHKTAALTLEEVLVVIVVLAILVGVVLLSLRQPRDWRKTTWCVNNLKQVGLAYRLWEGDNNDKYPMQVSMTNGGSMESVAAGNVVTTFQVMSNELSTPKLVLCPQDIKRQPAATNFSSQLAGHISYFVGLDAKEGDPQSILSGDDNFEIGGVPVESGLLKLSSNTPIAWTPVRHGLGGFFLLADGSVQSLSNSGLTNWLHQTGVATNRLAIP